jgi:hypothetical protein
MADYRAQRLARIRADYERFTAHSNPMTDNNLIPPPELVQQWADMLASRSDEAVFSLAAQWGADQELKACIDWISVWHGLEHPELLIELLRAARRPEPSSLKEQALAVLDDAELDAAHYNILLRALESIND